MKIMGLDIGGANIDCAVVEIYENTAKIVETKRKYLPMWIENDKLSDNLKTISKEISEVEIVCVSMTAELADSYLSKIDGVNDVINKVLKVYSDKKVYFVTVEGLKENNELKKNPIIVAAANWIGTVAVIKNIKESCIFMDIGSTTTDIIPIKNKKECALGHNDLERLSSGELVYTGMLRTNLATIVHEVPINNKNTRVSSELFSITGDIYRILNDITEEDYTCSTPDNQGTDLISCKRRLARLVCADLDLLNDDELYELAHYIKEKQICQIYDALSQVHSRTNINTVIVTSIGTGNLCEIAAKRLGLDVLSLENYLTKKASHVLTAIGAIQLYLDEKKNEIKIL